MNLVLTGAAGRMGQAVLKIIHQFPDIRLAGAVEAVGHPQMGKEACPGVVLSADLSKVVKDADVVLDFTNAEASITHLKMAANSKTPTVICATGHTTDQRAHIQTSSKIIPIVFSPNMSVGVNLMWKFIDTSARVLGKKDYQIDIVEAHHIHKKDAPSGTAKKMMEILAGTGGYNLDKDVFFHLEGGEDISKHEAQSMPRAGPSGSKSKFKAKICVKSIREGEIIGDHTIIFTSPYERLEITHRAFTREVFAFGALKACEWIVDRKPGLYGMGDVLGLVLTNG